VDECSYSGTQRQEEKKTATITTTKTNRQKNKENDGNTLSSHSDPKRWQEVGCFTEMFLRHGVPHALLTHF
jgi:hypothetical protein